MQRETSVVFLWQQWIFLCCLQLHVGQQYKWKVLLCFYGNINYEKATILSYTCVVFYFFLCLSSPMQVEVLRWPDPAFKVSYQIPRNKIQVNRWWFVLCPGILRHNNRFNVHGKECQTEVICLRTYYSLYFYFFRTLALILQKKKKKKKQKKFYRRIGDSEGFVRVLISMFERNLCVLRVKMRAFFDTE